MFGQMFGRWLVDFWQIFEMVFGLIFGSLLAVIQSGEQTPLKKRKKNWWFWGRLRFLMFLYVSLLLVGSPFERAE